MLPTNRFNLLNIFAVLLFLFVIALAPMITELNRTDDLFFLLFTGGCMALGAAGVMLILKQKWMSIVMTLLMGFAAIVALGAFFISFNMNSMGLDHITIGMFLSFVAAALFFQNGVVKSEFERFPKEVYLFERNGEEQYKEKNRPDLIKIIGLMMLGYTAIWGFSVGMFAERELFYVLLILVLFNIFASISFMLRRPWAKNLVLISIAIWIITGSFVGIGLMMSFGELPFLWMCYISLIASPVIMLLLMRNELVLWLFNNQKIERISEDDILDSGVF